MQAGAELTWLVCRSSVLNAEELARSGGLQVLGGLVQRWLDTPVAQGLLASGDCDDSSVNLLLLECFVAIPQTGLWLLSRLFNKHWLGMPVAQGLRGSGQCSTSVH